MIDPVDVVHTQLGVGVTLGGCAMTDWCRVNGSRCQHGARCVTEWERTSCDCRRAGAGGGGGAGKAAQLFSGKFCQFGTLSLPKIFVVQLKKFCLDRLAWFCKFSLKYMTRTLASVLLSSFNWFCQERLRLQV